MLRFILAGVLALSACDPDILDVRYDDDPSYSPVELGPPSVGVVFAAPGDTRQACGPTA